MNNTNHHNPIQTERKSALRKLTVAGLLLSLMPMSQAAPIHWTNGTASYNNALNWDPNSIPMASPNQDDAINDNGTNNVVQINVGDPDWPVRDIRAGDAANTAGAFEQNGQTVDIGGWFRLSVGSNAFGVYALNDGTLDVTGGRLNVAERGTGILNFNGGTITKSGDVFALGDAGFGTDDPATGIVNQVAGKVNSSSELWIGQFSGGVGEYNLSGSGTIVMSNWLAIGRADGTGVLNLSGNASITKAGGDGNITFAGIGASTGTLNQDGGAVTNIVSEVWLGESGTGTWNLNSGSAYLGFLQVGRNNGAVGTFNLNGGELSATEITSGSSAIGTFNFNGGTLKARADSTHFLHDIATVSVLGGGAVIDTDGHDVTIAAPVYEAVSGGTLTKNGPGTLRLTGTYYYSGLTTVNEGELVTTTSASTPGDYSIADGAGLGVVLQSQYTQLYVNNLTLGASGPTTLGFDLGAFGNPSVGYAPLSLTGALAVNGTVTVNIADQLPQVGQFPLIKYGSKSGSGSFVLAPLPTGIEAEIVLNIANNSIDLNITSVEAVRWDGQVGGDWDIDGTTNWVNTGTLVPSVYQDGNPAVFNDDALGTTTVNLTTTVSPNGVEVANNNVDYTFTGSGKISGPVGLTKKGTGTLSIENTGGNDYAGATVIQGGTLAVTDLADGGSPSAIGASTSDPANLVLSGGTLRYSGPAVSIDRGYSVANTNSAIQADSDLTLTGSVEASADTAFLKTGAATLSYAGTGTNLIGSGGVPGDNNIGFVGWAAYNVVDGVVLMDGTSGGLTNYVQGDIWVGGTLDSGAALTLSNATLQTSGWVAMGRGNGTSNFLSSITLQDSTINVTGGGFSAGYDADLPLNWGYQIQARQNLTLNGNSALNVQNNSIFIAERRGSTAMAWLNDTSSMSCSGWAGVGIGSGGSSSPSSGSVEIADSAMLSVGGWFSIGHEGGTGSVLVKENGQLYVGGDLNVTDVGNGCVGTLTAQDNAEIYANRIYVGKDTGVDAAFNVMGNATVVSTNNLIMARYFNGEAREVSNAVVNLAGGSLAVNRVEGSVTNGNQGTFNFNGGRLIARNPDTENFMYDLAAINVMSGGAVIDSDTYSISIAEPLLDAGGGGGLTKLGSGTLNLNGINAYTGSTMIDEGALGGTGVISGPVTVAAGGALTPGTSIGVLTINNTLTLGGNTAMEISRDSGTPESDLVTGVTTLTYGGTLTVINVGTNALQEGDTFNLFDAASINPALFSAMNLPSGYTWDTSQLGVNGSISVQAVLAPPPVLNPPVYSDGGLVLTGSGVPGASFTLVTSTNVAAPLANWQTNLTGLLDGTGSFSNSIPVNQSESTRFFNLRTP